MMLIGRYCDFCGIQTKKNRKHNVLRLCSKCRLLFYIESGQNWVYLFKYGIKEMF